MPGTETITDGVFLVGGPEITDGRDCLVYLVESGGELMLIDAGAGVRAHAILDNVSALGFDPEAISTLILTHCHIDHAGGAHQIVSRCKAQVVAHELDAAAIETGDPQASAATWYGLNLEPVKVDVVVTSPKHPISFGNDSMACIHTPGHTPGSMVCLLERNRERILFGQDVHGPLNAAFGSDVKDFIRSLQMMLSLEADILCEGHFGVYRGKDTVADYISEYIREYAGRAG